MSWPASSQESRRRRRRGRRPNPRLRGWGPEAAAAAEEEEEEQPEQLPVWACPPSPRRGRWEDPPPADWEPEEPPLERDAGSGPPPPPAPWDRSPSPLPSWGGRPRSRSPGQPWGSPPREAAWGRSESGGSRGRPRRQWEPGQGGGRWSSPERMGGGGRRRTPSPRQRAWNSPEDFRRPQSPDGDSRAWGSPGREGSWGHSRNVEGPAWEQRPGSPGGAGGRWGSEERRQEERESPGSRERRSLASPGRDMRQERHRSISGWSQQGREEAVDSSNGTGSKWGGTERRREPYSTTRKQRGWGFPKRGARGKHSGSMRHHASGQGQVNPSEIGSRWRSASGRGRNYQNRGRDVGSTDKLKGEWQNPDREQGSPVRYREAENPDKGRAERDGHEEERGTCDARTGSPEASTSLTDLISGSSSAPKEWTPCESVVNWWMECQSMPQNSRTREHMMSICPRPTLPDRSSETPQVNPSILSLLNRKQEKELRSARHIPRVLQDEVLDMLAPAMTICEMAEEAIEKAEPVDPMELREWSRHLIRFIGSINHRLTLHHRCLVLGTINPQLKMLVSKLSGQSAQGMLFAEDKVKLLKEIIMRFPQLTEERPKMPWRGFHVATRGALRRPLLGPRSRLMGIGRRGKAVLRVEHSQEGGGQGPAERH